MPDLDSQIPKTYEKTPISQILYILMIDLQLTSNFDLQMAVMTSTDNLTVFKFQIQKAYKMTPLSPIQYTFMFDPQLTSNFDLQMAVTTSSDI